MSKDFDIWNIKKKNIDNAATKLYHARDIWWCSLGLNVGFEQDGSGEDFQRPILILKGFSKQVCLAIPLTTSQKKNKYHIPLGIIDGKQSFAIISQIRLIDTRRLVNKIAVLDKLIFETIRKATKELL
jgi:mRNA interferase MazF